MKWVANYKWEDRTSGEILVHRHRINPAEKQVEEAFALTCPLITKIGRHEIRKTESGYMSGSIRKKHLLIIFMQFWLNVSDEDAARLH